MSWTIKNSAKVIDEGDGMRKGIAFDITWDGTIPRDFAEVVIDLDLLSLGAKNGSDPRFAQGNKNTLELTLKQIGTAPPKATVIVYVTGDTLPEVDETIALTLRSAVWYETDPATGALVNTGTETVNLVSSTLIRDDDAPPAGTGFVPTPGTPVSGGGGAEAGAGVDDTGGGAGGGGGAPATPSGENTPETAHVDPPKDAEAPPEDPLTEHTDPPKDGTGPDPDATDPPAGEGAGGAAGPADPPKDDAAEASGGGLFGSRPPTPETDNSDLIVPPGAEIDIEIDPPSRPKGIDWDKLLAPDFDSDLGVRAFDEWLKSVGLATESGAGGSAGPAVPTGGEGKPAEDPEVGGTGASAAQPKPGAPIPSDDAESGPVEQHIESLRDKGFVTGDDVALASAGWPNGRRADSDTFLFREAPMVKLDDDADATDVYVATSLITADPFASAIPNTGTAPAEDAEHPWPDLPEGLLSVSPTAVDSSLYDLG